MNGRTLSVKKRAGFIALALLALGAPGSTAATHEAGQYLKVDYPGSTAPGELQTPVTYTLWIPAGVVRLRCIIVHQHGAGTTASIEGSTAAYDLHWQALAKKWDCALFSSSYHVANEKIDLTPGGSEHWFDPRRGSEKTFLKALGEFAARSGHPEIATVPWALWGHSGGGIWADVMSTLHPERIVAIWMRSGSAIMFRPKPEFPQPQVPAAVYAIPSICNPGVKEKPNLPWVGTLATFQEYRAQGAFIGFAPDPRTGHECGDSRYLAIPFFDACLAMRLPDKGSTDQTLKPVDQSHAWLATPLSEQAVPAASYQGNPSEAVWLPNEVVARAWMEYVKTGAVSDTTPPPAPHDVKATAAGERAACIEWSAAADFESGIRCFRVLRDGKELAQVPPIPVGKFGRPLFQSMTYHDTPAQPLPKMEYVDTASQPGDRHTYTVVTVNSVGLPSEPSAPATPVPASRAPTPQLPGVGAAIQAAMDAREIAGAVTVVVTKDKILHLEANGLADISQKKLMQPDTLFWIASMTKPVTAVAVLMLQDEGKLNVADPVAKYIPAFADLKTPSGKPANLTITQILTHTSGLGEAPAAGAREAHTLADLVPLWLAAPMQYEPGAKWQYTQSGINLAARIVEVVSGMSFDAFVQQRIFDPLGMENSTFYPSPGSVVTAYAKNRTTGALESTPPRNDFGVRDRPPLGNGGLYSTGPDYARFCQMLLGGGMFDGKRYLSPDAMKLLTTVQTGDLPCGFFQSAEFGNHGVNYGWGIGTCILRQPHEGVAEKLSPGTFGHGGAWGTQAWIDPVRGVAYVLMVQRSNFPNSDASSVRRAFQQAAVDALTKTAGPDFGPNVLVFDPSQTGIQERIDAVFKKQESNQFGSERYAVLFKPGKYNLDVQVGFYTQVLGLGKSPDDVAITGAVRCKANWMRNHNATCNFWRTVENLSVTPTQDNNVNIWAVSQGVAMRRTHIKGDLNLWDGGWSSGGFLADCKIDGQVNSGSQQQWLSRNDEWGKWVGSNWNMVFVGVTNPPAGEWPARPYTVVEKTPVIREKPYLMIDEAGKYFVVVPALRTEPTQGASWTGPWAGTAVPMDKFHIAHPDRDTAASINAALGQGKHLLLTPGIYHLESSIKFARPGTVVLGLGYPTLVPDKGTAAIEIADVDGVKVGGVLLEAPAANSPTLLAVGEPGSKKSHAADPIFLYDIYCRVGGAGVGTTDSMVTIHSSDVVGDNFWLWRADHGRGAGWTSNKNTNGLIVNGDHVTIYGLFVEHTQEYQTVWNGNGGRVYFYQSEMPYDPPSQEAWRHGAVNGFASYKVADNVTTHEAWGVGVYCVFNRAPVVADNAIETPTGPGIKMHHMVSIRLGGGRPGSGINHVINGTGDPVLTKMKATVD